MTHEVSVNCDCDDIEACRMELYISDVRIAYLEIVRLMQRWGQAVAIDANLRTALNVPLPDYSQI